jgi:hypothetical protein
MLDKPSIVAPNLPKVDLKWDFTIFDHQGFQMVTGLKESE